MSEQQSASRVTDEEALELHAEGRPGKLEITATKPLTTARDLSLAYSPGVAVPCLKIAEDPQAAYKYTTKGNMVAVISNGSAVLGLGNLGALASKPVMEGKAVLFKRFADIDGIDIEVDTEDTDEFINCVRFLGKSWGGINLEDIKAPDCFIIEQRLREVMDIPVFHDDQHGTAIIAAAALLNALEITGRDIKETRMVINGAGAAAIACVELFKAMGMPHDQVILCDTKGVIYTGREAGMNQWKSAHAVNTDLRSLEQAVDGADVFVGVSVKGALTKDMVKSMAEQPIIFALANPDPEITPEEAREARSDAIIATGRSDYPNQVNNVLGFPYIFRGALDVQAREINDAMKIAAAKAIAALAREDVPDEVGAAYSGRRLQFGPDYLIPVPFDGRLIVKIPEAVAQAAMDTGVAARPIENMWHYRQELKNRLDPTAGSLQRIFSKLKETPRTVVFAEGEEEQTIRAAIDYAGAGYGKAILIGREDRLRAKADTMGVSLDEDQIQVANAALSKENDNYTQYIYRRQQRRGALYRDCQRMVNQNRNVFAACMLANGEADAMVTGLTRPFSVCLDDIKRAVSTKPSERTFGLSVMVRRNKTLFIADTLVNEEPDSETLALMAIQAAEKARRLGHEPRVALLSFSNFGQPLHERGDRIRNAVAMLSEREVGFEFDGEMSADVALDYDLMKRLYPFCNLTGPANILIMPGLQTANVSAKLLQKMSASTLLGPMLLGLECPAQVVQMGATVSDIVNAAALAAFQSMEDK